MENNLPEGWTGTPLSEIVEYRKGKKPKRMENAPFSGSLVYLDIRAIEKNVDEIFVDRESSSLTDASDIIVVWDGARAGWVSKSRHGALGSTIMAIKPKINEDYLYRFLQTQFGYIQSNHRGTGIPHVDPDIFWSIEVPIAPLPEQHRIVAKLDALMERVERNKQRLDKIPALLKRFRQSVLAAAVSGRLTEGWRRENTTISALALAELSAEREKLQRNNALMKGQKSFRYKPPVSIDIGGKTKGIDELYAIPQTWHWITLDHCVWSVSDGPHFSPEYVEPQNGIAFISSRNVSYDKIDFSDAKYVAETDHYEFIKRGRPERGDILLTKGGTTGIAHLINVDTQFSIWVHVALLKVIKKFVCPEYLRDVLTSDFLYRQSQAQTHGVGNQDLGLTRMIYMTIPLPPLAEQHEIVRRVEQLFAFADKIEARYVKAKAMLDRLPQSILAKAFKGELVPQDPADEPAAVLLERIRAERGAGGKTKVKQKKVK